MTVEFIRRILYIILREKRVKLNLGPEEFSEMLHLCSIKQFKVKLGIPEQYQPGMPVPKQGYEITNRITADLSPFKVMMGKKQATPPLVFDDNGYASIPASFYYPGRMIYNWIVSGNVKPRKVDILSDLEWADTSTDVLTKGTFRNPIVNIQKDYIEIQPKEIVMVDFNYLKLPTAPTWAFTTNEGYMKYDAANSVQLEWDDMNIIDIIILFLSEFGISMSPEQIVSYSEKVKNQGI